MQFLFTLYQNYRFSYPFLYLNLGNPYPFYIPGAFKGYSFLAEPPCTDYLDSNPPHNPHPPPSPRSVELILNRGK